MGETLNKQAFTRARDVLPLHDLPESIDPPGARFGGVF